MSAALESWSPSVAAALVRARADLDDAAAWDAVEAAMAESDPPWQAYVAAGPSGRAALERARDGALGRARARLVPTLSYGRAGLWARAHVVLPSRGVEAALRRCLAAPGATALDGLTLEVDEDQGEDAAPLVRMIAATPTAASLRSLTLVGFADGPWLDASVLVGLPSLRAAVAVGGRLAAPRTLR